MKLNENKLHPMVRVTYIPRIIGFYFAVLIVLSTYSKETSIIVWSVTLLLGLGYPHIAHIAAKLSKNSRRAGVISLHIDTFIFGAWSAHMSFSLVPSVTIMCMILANNLLMGGFRQFLTSILSSVLGMSVIAYYNGIQFNSDTPMQTIVCTLLFMTAFTWTVFFGSYKMTLLFVKTRKELERQWLGRITTLFPPREKHPGSSRLAAVPVSPSEHVLCARKFWLND